MIVLLLHSARLRSSLPQMVVDVLEEKMEEEYRTSALSLLNNINKTQVRSKDDEVDDDDDDDDLRNSIVSRFSLFIFVHTSFQM